MADTTTSWILQFVDHVTKPVKDVVKSVTGMTADIQDATEAVQFNERETKEALTKAKKYYNDLAAQVSQAEQEVKDLEKTSKTAAPGKAAEKANREYQEAAQRVTKLRAALTGADQDVQQLTEQSKKFTREEQKWAEKLTGVNQGLELMDKAINGLNFSVDVADQTTEIQRMTELGGDALDNFVARARKAGDLYKADVLDIARAANAMTRQVGGSYESNLASIERGFRVGSNINGDFLDQLKEYQPFIKQLGLTNDQAIAIMAKAGKDGIYSDKAIDALKEANLALREMDKTQQDALKGIGLKPDALLEKTPFEAIQYISKQMQGKAPELRQKIIADIFKGAGEDAGMQFIDGLGSMELDITKLPQVEAAGAGMKGFFSDVSSWAGQAFGNVGIYAQQIAPVFQVLAGAIPLVQLLVNSTRIATAAQWLWNAAMTANPIGLIIVGITALVGAIAWVVSSISGWGKAWDHVVTGAQLLWKAFIFSVSAQFHLLVDGIMIGINKIKEGWYEFKNAMGLGDETENNKMLSQIREDTEARKKVIEDSYLAAAKTAADAADEFVKAGKSLTWGDGETETEAKTNTNTGTNTTNTGNLLNYDSKTLNPTKKGKTGTANGLQVNGTGSGSKSISMTLNVTNNFSVSNKQNIRDIADELTGMINDRMRDGVISLG